MASQDVTETATAISGIAIGKLYIVQNRTGGPIYVEEAASAAATDPKSAHLLEPLRSAAVSLTGASNSIFVWLDNLPNRDAFIAYSEAAT